MIRAALQAYRLWLAAAAGYLVGCVLCADIAARLANRRRDRDVDLRAVGSGNPGGANAMANLGKAWGAAVIFGDIAKGAIGAGAGRMIAGDAGAYAGAVATVAGHCFPATAGFRGGKGVAAAGGTTLTAFPVFVPLEVTSVVGTLVATQSAGKATAVGTGLLCACALLWRSTGWPTGRGPRPSWGLPLYAAGITSIIAQRFATAPAHMGDIPRGAAAVEERLAAVE